MDDNNQILPIGYGIFPKETTDSWTWFLEKLHEYIGDVEALTMVTDTAPAITAIYPLSELSDWEVPDDLMVINPPVMEIRQAGRPKNTNRIPSQGEEPKIRRCSRCHSTTNNTRTYKEIVPNNQSKSKKCTGASGSWTKSKEEEPTQATEN
ncbi:unnamed protein product [Lactuca saligna]|uniref:MULE transposase domain-containing protein n=1 Tax=Lactuca saligna TaxID=75948 RepID=A0AA35ZS35_LACSI|nr:unnamed protein product [Lactuca saligna]